MTRTRAMYLAVVPAYRSECIEALKQEDPAVDIFCSASHLDPTVKTGIDTKHYTEVRMTRVAGRFFLQTGHLRDAIGVDDLIVDMNPRSITAWVLLLIRRPFPRKRTLVWGHLHPQKGPLATTKGLRTLMRRLSQGTITYTYGNLQDARSELPNQPVWVAPNSLYRPSQLQRAVDTSRERNSLLYVGRFSAQKKVHLAIQAFVHSKLAKEGAELVLIGDGPERQLLEAMVKDQNHLGSVKFAGWREDFDELKEFYSTAFVALSPGFAGLGLTQALGFGVPMILARQEPHSPEIELAHAHPTYWFDSDNVGDLAEQMILAWRNRSQTPMKTLSQAVQETYSTDQMARGLLDALKEGNSLDFAE